MDIFMQLRINSNTSCGHQQWIKCALLICSLCVGSSATAQTVTAPAGTSLSTDDARFQAEIEALASHWEQINEVMHHIAPSSATAPGAVTALLKAAFKGDDTLVTTRTLSQQQLNILKDVTTMVGGADGVKAATDQIMGVVKAVNQIIAGGELQLNAGGQAIGVSNLRAGEVSAGSTDAVIGSQLAASNQRIGQLDTQLDALATRTRADTAAAKAYTDESVGSVQRSLTAVEKVANLATASVGEIRSNVQNLQKELSGSVHSTSNSQPPPKATGDNSVAIGGGARALGDNSVAVGASAVTNRANTVSVGRPGFERQITHVAAGTRDTDAVSVTQLSRTTAFATQQARNYTDQRYGQLRRDLKQQDDTLSAGIAGAMAMANLPRSTVAGGSMTSVAVGNYRSESALAVGISYVSDSGRWSSSFMGSTNSQNDVGAAVGVGYQW